MGNGRLCWRADYMSEHQKDTAFLTQVISYDDTDERRNLAEHIARLQRDERCVRSAVWLMLLVTALALAGIGYGAVFRLHPMNLEQFMTQSGIKILSALALGSLICVVTFLGLGVSYRNELAKRRDECRRLAAKFLERRFGIPRDKSTPEGSQSAAESHAFRQGLAETTQQSALSLKPNSA
jgi:hypothetical protein